MAPVNKKLYKIVPLFTKRETQIIQLICQGYNSQKIADHLYLSIRTIESHRESIYRKMKVKSIARLVVFAIKNGIYKI